MAQPLTPEDRRRYELSWAAQAVKLSCTAAELEDWRAYRYTSRLHAYRDKILLIWRYQNGQPVVVGTLRVTGISLSFASGLQIAATLRNGEHYVITSTPSKLPSLDVFIWAPALNEVRFTPSDWENANAQRTVRFALNFKQKRNPVDGPEEGQHYLSELTGFRRMWPAFAETRF